MKVKKIKEKVPTATVDIISLNVPFKPKGESPHKNWYWCPYCNKWRPFIYNDSFGQNKCIICGISDLDFYVKKYNGLGKQDYIDTYKKK